HNPERNVKSMDIAGGEEDSGNNTHRFLRIVGAVSQTVGGGGNELQSSKPLIHAEWSRVAHQPEGECHKEKTQDHSNHGREHDEDERLGPSRQNHDTET